MIVSILFLAMSVGPSPCLPVEGERILGRDLAKANPSFAAAPPEVPIGYAPSPGARRIFRPAQLRRLANRWGLSLDKSDEICFERPLQPLTRERLLSSMEASLGRMKGHIEIIEFIRYPTPQGEVVFPISGLGKPPSLEPRAPVMWRGFVRYAGKRRFRIWARVKISVSEKCAVALEKIEAGRPIGAGQVRVETRESFPGLTGRAKSLDEVVGHIPRRSIRAGSTVRLDLLKQPKDIDRGDLVYVIAKNGGARIEFEARAQSPGSRGESILVRNPATGRNFRGRVEGKGRVSVGMAKEEAF
jgi:flagella basal body P-ring formation protein FlgA